MVRNTRAAHHEDAPWPVIAVGNEYPTGYFHPPHMHRRAQLLYAEYGTMAVDTAEGAWVVPPQQGVWISSGVQHSIRMLSDVATRSVYFDVEVARAFPSHCRVMGISALLRQLLIEAVDLPVDYAPESRSGKIMSLIVEEVGQAPELPLCVPMPRHALLATHCRNFVLAPSILQTADDWAFRQGQSRRTFTRFFRKEIGLGFSEWQRRVCVQVALERLPAGEAVTRIAFDMGYSSSSAFTAMFTRLLGVPPRQFLGNSH